MPSASPGSEGDVQSGAATTSEWVPWATLGAAVIAAVVALVSSYLQRKTGREASANAARSATAAEKSAEASLQAAAASERSVTTNSAIAADAALRADAAVLSKRYQDAAEQLGHEKAPVRIAGVYAMARLADDWPEQRQTCVDVLVALLRLPWIAVPGDQASTEGSEAAINRRGDLEVRRTILRLFGEHLVDPHPASWSDYRLDLRECVLPGFRWSAPAFRAPVLLSEAIFNENTTIASPSFQSDAHLERIVLNGALSLVRVRTQGRLSFEECVVNGGLGVDLAAVAPQSTVTFEKMVVNGAFQLKLNRAEMPQGPVYLTEVEVNGFSDVAAIRWEAPDQNFPDIHFSEVGGPSPLNIRSISDEPEFNDWPGYSFVKERHS